MPFLLLLSRSQHTFLYMECDVRVCSCWVQLYLLHSLFQYKFSNQTVLIKRMQLNFGFHFHLVLSKVNFKAAKFAGSIGFHFSFFLLLLLFQILLFAFIKEWFPRRLESGWLFIRYRSYEIEDRTNLFHYFTHDGSDSLNSKAFDYFVELRVVESYLSRDSQSLNMHGMNQCLLAIIPRKEHTQFSFQRFLARKNYFFTSAQDFHSVACLVIFECKLFQFLNPNSFVIKLSPFSTNYKNHTFTEIRQVVFGCFACFTVTRLR